MPDTTKPIRYHSLDALRAFALLLGIVFHAAESFCPGRKSWAIIDSRAHDAFDLFQHVCHSFRMEIFFLIAGFFAHMLLQKIGTRAFVAHRVRRILVPLAVGWLFLYPMFMLIWIWGKSVSGSLGDLGIPQQLQHLGVFQLAAGVIVTGAFLRDAFSLIHLWFLYYLLLLYAGELVIRVTAARFATAIDRVFGWICRTRYRLVFFALATIPLIAKMHGGVDTPNRSLIPNLTVLALYGVFFGWFLHRQPELLSEVTRGWGFYLAAGAAAILITVYGHGILNGVFPGGISKSSMLGYRSTLYGMMMWSFVLGITGAFITLFRRESPVWRYIADSSYWLYMVHHIVVVPMQILVARLDISAVIKYALIDAVTFPALFVSYHFLVRPTFIGAALNGHRYPPLAKELDFLDSYLAIMKARFQERIQVAVDIAPETRNCDVPHLILQPLVENSIKHCTARTDKEGKVRIAAHREGAELHIVLEDNGPGLSPAADTAANAGSGIGLSNTRDRLNQLYGTQHRFEMTNIAGGGLRIVIQIPARESSGKAASQ